MVGKKLTITLAIIAVVAVIALVLVATGLLNPVTSHITQEPLLSVSETHGSDLYLRAEMSIHVTNNGGASASGVTVTVGSSGGDSKSQSLGNIAEGQTKTADFIFVLLRGGDYTFHATAACFEGSSDGTTFTAHVNGL